MHEENLSSDFRQSDSLMLAVHLSACGSVDRKLCSQAFQSWKNCFASSGCLELQQTVSGAVYRPFLTIGRSLLVTKQAMLLKWNGVHVSLVCSLYFPVTNHYILFAPHSSFVGVRKYWGCPQVLQVPLKNVHPAVPLQSGVPKIRSTRLGEVYSRDGCSCC